MVFEEVGGNTPSRPQYQRNRGGLSTKAADPADALYGDFVGKHTFSGYVASQRGELFRDEHFATLYCANNGRPSVPPSLLAIALVLQTYDGVSDEEATRRAAFDLQMESRAGHRIGRGRSPRARSRSFERS